jgi:murein DD-endopeptidase MepM/ murein hydrolase activator NlpD
MKTKKIKLFWLKLRKNWAQQFHFIIRKEKNLHDVFTLKLTPRKIFVLSTVAFLLITMFTAFLIAFTPLRYYVPGYTNPVEYKLYRQILARMDSIERMNEMRTAYLNNFQNVINDIVVFKEMDAPTEEVAAQRAKDKNKTTQAYIQVNDAAEQLLIEIADRNSKTYIPLSQIVTYPTFAFTMPALGIITNLFSIPDKHYGIDIENEKGALVTAIADGVIIGSEFSETEGNTLIIQHSGNIVSQYKNLDLVLKNIGAKVKSGDPIATMGNKGKESQNPYLHFEIWYNGTPINPVDYFIGN